jgi:hypothetical protein
MAVYINFVCDNKCSYGIQQINFDNENETWGDMLVAARSWGWELEVVNSQVVKSICPECKNSNK